MIPHFHRMEISSRLVVKEIGISEISTGNTVESITTPPDSVNAIAWSPDGNYIVMCGAYESNGARVQVHEYDGNSWPIIWEVPTTTSCSSADFSPDGSKFVIGMYWYLADGATAKVYETDTGLLVIPFQDQGQIIVDKVITNAVKLMESHGTLMVVKLLPHILGTMREFIFGLQMLMKIMTATIQLTKGTGRGCISDRW